jgi:hypothetical protein
MHAMPTKMDAVTEKIVRRDMMLSFPSTIAEKAISPWSPDPIDFGTSRPGSCNLVPSVMHCVIASLI